METWPQFSELDGFRNHEAMPARRSILPLYWLPNDGFLNSLDRLIEDQEAFRSFAISTHDGRLSALDWGLLLRKELLLLHYWALRRILSYATDRDNPISQRFGRWPSQVLSLLPRAGIAVHVLRRAVPFAAVEIPTVCGFPREVRAEARAVVYMVGKVLNIESWLKPLRATPETAAAAANQNHLVVVTGRRKSITKVAERTVARLVGCAGRCVVVVGRSRTDVIRLVELLRSKHVINSCTRVRAGFVLYPHGRIRGLGKQPWIGPLREALERLHPSVVIEISKGRRKFAPKTLCGYRLVRSDAQGKVDDQSGFATDPIYGWPGDYAF
jgi:hypothetical protein